MWSQLFSQKFSFVVGALLIGVLLTWLPEALLGAQSAEDVLLPTATLPWAPMCRSHCKAPGNSLPTTRGLTSVEESHRTCLCTDYAPFLPFARVHGVFQHRISTSQPLHGIFSIKSPSCFAWMSKSCRVCPSPQSSQH